MCPPEYFTVAYIINPWMHGNLRRIDNAVARQQWRSLYDHLTDIANVRLVLPQPSSPDMVFTANAGLVKGSRFIVSRFRYPERQNEEPYFADWFQDRGLRGLDDAARRAFRGCGRRALRSRWRYASGWPTATARFPRRARSSPSA
jgi:N-dimethylarginine dimethylaminohydrolase